MLLIKEANIVYEYWPETTE